MDTEGKAVIKAQVWAPGVTDKSGKGENIIGQLWSNITGEWAPLDMQHYGYAWMNINNDEYSLSIGPLPVGEYEFTVRFSGDNGKTWVWPDIPQNGKIKIVPRLMPPSVKIIKPIESEIIDTPSYEIVVKASNEKEIRITATGGKVSTPIKRNEVWVANWSEYANGNYTINATAINIVGETTDSVIIKVDAPNPIFVDMWPKDNETILAPTYNLHCVTSNANNVDFAVSSGLLGDKWSPDKNNYFQHWYNYTEGIHTIKATIWNWGGENIVIERKVIYDLTPPETIYNILEPKYITDKIYVYPKTKTIIELNATDNLSGIKFIYNTNYIQIKNLDEGIQNIKYKAIDKANNIEQEKLLILNVDGTAPQTIITIGEPKYNLGAEEPVLISSKTPITLSATDPTVSGVSSGVAKIEYKIGLLGN